MKKTLVLLAILFSGFCFAQTEAINNYKYLILPEKFSFLKEPNKYNLNDLTKMVFEKYGFTVYYQNGKMPDELMLNKCLALFGDLKDDSGMLNTSISILIKDCSGVVLYESEKGKSKVKDYRKAYYESLREASASLASLNYHYTGPATVATTTPQAVPVSAQPAQAQSALAATPVPVAVEGQLFAQPIANGYQLVDTTPKVIAKMYKTSQQDYFTAQGDNKNGVIFKKGNDWFFEYYLNDKLVSEKLNIKF